MSMPIDHAACVPLRGCRSLAVFRALQLGDILCAVPALRALRQSVPGARITLVGLPSPSAFAARFRRYIAAFVAFTRPPELPEPPPDVARLPAFLSDLQAPR